MFNKVKDNLPLAHLPFLEQIALAEEFPKHNLGNLSTSMQEFDFRNHKIEPQIIELKPEKESNEKEQVIKELTVNRAGSNTLYTLIKKGKKLNVSSVEKNYYLPEPKEATLIISKAGRDYYFRLEETPGLVTSTSSSTKNYLIKYRNIEIIRGTEHSTTAIPYRVPKDPPRAEKTPASLEKKVDNSGLLQAELKQGEYFTPLLPNAERYAAPLQKVQAYIGENSKGQKVLVKFNERANQYVAWDQGGKYLGFMKRSEGDAIIRPYISGSATNNPNPKKQPNEFIQKSREAAQKISNYINNPYPVNTPSMGQSNDWTTWDRVKNFANAVTVDIPRTMANLFRR
jgi:hypothetical protein